MSTETTTDIRAELRKLFDQLGGKLPAYMAAKILDCDRRLAIEVRREWINEHPTPQKPTPDEHRATLHSLYSRYGGGLLAIHAAKLAGCEHDLASEVKAEYSRKGQPLDSIDHAKVDVMHHCLQMSVTQIAKALALRHDDVNRYVMASRGSDLIGRINAHGATLGIVAHCRPELEAA